MRFLRSLARRLSPVALSLLVAICLAGLAGADDAGVAGKKLTIIDAGTSSGKAKLLYLAKLDPGIQKGADGSASQLDATLEIFYTDDPNAGRSRFEMPQGTGWRLNSGKAKYLNQAAPTNGAVKLAFVKPGTLARVMAKALGDTPENSLDLFAGGEPSAEGGLTTVLTIYNRNDGSLHRMCTKFATSSGSTLSLKEIGGGAGRKLIAKNGVPTACTLDYTDDSMWLCKPGMTENQCFVNGLNSTRILPDNSTAFEAHTGSETHDYDCFYVYPTVDLLGPIGNHTDFSDISLELDPLLEQAARFNNSCRIFAPLYRQVTLGTFGSSDASKFLEIGYRDVKAAFDHYMDQHNAGRNLVIMGHSQGTMMTSQLIQDEIDPSPELRGRLITALLIGGRVTVPEGQLVGGTFQNIPLCSADAETGCVIAYRTYAEGFPPAGGSNVMGPEGTDTACTNPAALTGGEELFKGAYFALSYNQPLYNVTPFPDFGTPYDKYEDFYAGECVKDDQNRSYLEIRVRRGPGDLRENLIPFDSWLFDPSFLGTHVIDYSFPLGDLIELVELKAAAMP